jgi:hypothetical protein
MMQRWRALVIAGIAFILTSSAIFFVILRKQVRTTARVRPPTEEQARRELTQLNAVNPDDPKEKALFFWAAESNGSALTPVTVDLPLAKDPVQRSKQILNTLLAGPVDADLRTLPPEAALLAFYLLPDGTGIADFSDSLATSIPSGIQSEQLAADSITRTLEANVPQVKRLRILIHGQEVETLAGHLDLTGTLVVSRQTSKVPPPPPAVGASSPSAATPAGKPLAPESLTPDKAPVKLAAPERNP